MAIVLLPLPAFCLEIENGWYTVDGKIVWGYVQHNDWWKGAAVPADRPNITRRELDENGELVVAPNRTEDLDKLTDNMKQFSYPGFEHNFGLWYDRRRDSHQAECQTDAEAIGPYLEQPWARSDNGVACDGLPQYDLTEFNPWYFDRAREFAELSDEKGLVFYYNFFMQHALLEVDAHYADFPWRPGNTIQLTELPAELPAANVFFDALHAERAALHRLYIRKGLDELGDSTNSIFQLSQEYTGPLSFVEFWIDTIMEWEDDTGKSVAIALGATKDVLDAVLQDPLRGPRVHTIDLRYWWYQEDGMLFAPLGGAEMPGRYAIDGSIGGTSYGSYSAFKSSPEQLYRQTREYRDLYPDKAILHDAFSETQMRQFSWAFLMAGGSLLVPGYVQYATNYPTDYEEPVITTIIQPTTDFINEHLADILPRSRPADLVTNNSDPPENWVLAVPNTLYLVYALRGGSFSLDLSGATGTYRARWFDPRTGVFTRLNRSAVSGGEVVEFTAPDDQDWALWLSAPCAAAQTPDVLVVSEQSIVTPIAEVSCAQIFAGPSLNVEAGGDLTLQAPLVTLVDGFSVEHGGKLAIDNVTPVPNAAGLLSIH